jgi:hypothetical protein
MHVPALLLCLWHTMQGLGVQGRWAVFSLPPLPMQDTNAMRDMVQKLCQSSHPLAKSMDYLQVRVTHEVQGCYRQ